MAAADLRARATTAASNGEGEIHKNTAYVHTDYLSTYV